MEGDSFIRRIALDKGYRYQGHWFLVLEPCGHILIRPTSYGWPAGDSLLCERCLAAERIGIASSK